ncbi:DnaD domain protein [Fructilactobacillus sanfranciscensis]
MKSKELNSTDKCIYGVIYTMLNTTRKCFMSNARIANEISSTPKSVSRSITKLSRLGLLKVELTYKKDSKQVDKRFITLGNTPIPKNEHRVCSNKSIGIPKNEQDNRLLNRLSYKDDDDDKNDFEIRQKIMREFQTNIANVSSSYVTEQINDWINTVGADLVMRAVEVAIENTAHSFKYVNSILTDWQKKNIKTVEQANDYMAEHNKKKAAFVNGNINHNKRGVEDEDLGF